MDEEHTITAVRHGDSNQYAHLVERYWVGLVIYCERIIGDRAEAEDIAQKAFIKAYDNIGQFDPSRARFCTWLYKIARNLSLDLLRATKRTALVASDEFELLEPATVIEHEQIVLDVRRAVQQLEPHELQIAITAYYWEGKSYQAIADELGVPLNTVKTWLHRAKQQLRSKLS